jgi:hypothetical protein
VAFLAGSAKKRMLLRKQNRAFSFKVKGLGNGNSLAIEKNCPSPKRWTRGSVVSGQDTKNQYQQG